MEEFNISLDGLDADQYLESADNLEDQLEEEGTLEATTARSSKRKSSSRG